MVVQTENYLGVFELPAATARGTIFDVSEIDNDSVFDILDNPQGFPLGYCNS